VLRAMDKADLVLHEGRIMGHPESDSIAIAAGRIAAHGRFDELKGLVGPRTHLVRLAGRTVACGFIDSHIHFLEAASVASGVSVSRARTVADLLVELRMAAARTPPGNWLRAFGCDESLLRERRGPSRRELDQVVPRNPLRLRHQTLHASWLNSRAITLLGLEAPDFKPPPGSWIEKDSSGRATGLVVEMEQWLSSRLPLTTDAEIEARARHFSRELASNGVTAFTDATVRNGLAEFKLFERLKASGAISQRVSLMLGAGNLDELNDVQRTVGSSPIRLAGVKVMPDVRQQAVLNRLVANAMSRGLDCAFHVTEVDELDAALTALESATQRHEAAVGRIEHGGMIPPDAVDRIAAMQAWVVTNPGFIYYRGVKYAAEPGLVPYLYRLRSLAERGIELVGATDAPVTPARPLAAIAAATARCSLEGYELGLEERLSVEHAFSLFTESGARLARLEAGRLDPGLLADLIVLPRDPMELGPADLLNLPVDLTLIGGKVVYERGRPVVANSASAELHSP
jgi:predicted amidohydrolase YtcJ